MTKQNAQRGHSNKQDASICQASSTEFGGLLTASFVWNKMNTIIFLTFYPCGIWGFFIRFHKQPDVSIAALIYIVSLFNPKLHS